MGLAEDLWNARTTATVTSVADGDRPATVAEAYAVQAAINEAAGVALIGYKIGASAQATMDLLGLEAPFFGPLFDRYCYENRTDVAIVPAHRTGIEAEFVVALNGDLPARGKDYSREDVEEVVDWMSPGFELVGARFDAELAGAGTMLIADSGANAGFIPGDRVPDWRQFDFSRHPATLSINGEERASGHSGMSIFGHPFGTVAWLANQPELAGRGLRAGDVISTGTCTGLIPISPGDEVRAEFGDFGTLESRFT